MTRSYGQLCPLARALDRIGDRWTPLVIRDLASGPKRYSDLLKGLPGIGTTLLAERLQRLQAEGLVLQRELPPPAASTVYELSESGHGLFAALRPLYAWGLRYLDDVADDEVRPEWMALFLERNFDRDAASGVHDVYEFRVGANAFHVLIDDGRLTVEEGPAPKRPDAVVSTTWSTLVQLATGEADPEQLAAAGEVTFEGSQRALRRCYDILVAGRAAAHAV